MYDRVTNRGGGCANSIIASFGAPGGQSASTATTNGSPSVVTYLSLRKKMLHTGPGCCDLAAMCLLELSASIFASLQESKITNMTNAGFRVFMTTPSSAALKSVEQGRR